MKLRLNTLIINIILEKFSIKLSNFDLKCLNSTSKKSFTYIIYIKYLRFELIILLNNIYNIEF